MSGILSQDEIDSLVSQLLQEVERQPREKIEEVEDKLIHLQTEVERIKKELDDPETHARIYDGCEELLAAAQKNGADLAFRMVENGAKAAFTLNSTARFNYSPIDVGIDGYILSLDDISEDGVANAADVFANPRRIKILKLAINKPGITAPEISLKTRLFGNQLTHHLTLLENAKMIEHVGNGYGANPMAQIYLAMLHWVIGDLHIENSDPDTQTPE